MSAPAVSLRDASVQRGGRPIWSGVNVSVMPGEFVGVLGPNGAGKSTLLQVVLGLLQVDAGDVRVFDQPPHRGNPRIGYLPQRHGFDAATRIRGVDVVRLGLDGDRWGIPLPPVGRAARERAAAARQRIREVIDLVGATGYAGRPIGELSGGEQQRLLIAQALVRRPGLLVLDEPLESLDVANQAAVSSLIQQVCHVHGVAVLLVAHDVNPILPYLDQVLYLADGAAVCGAPGEVITAETLSRLYGTPIDVLRDRMGRLVVVGQPDVSATHRV